MAIDEQRVGAALMGRRSFWDRNRERLTAFQLVLRSNPNMAIGLFILVLAVMLAAFAPFIATDAPKELFTEPRLQAPSRDAYFGTDSVGRDVFSRTIYGSQLSLAIGASVTILTLIGGVVIGITAGYYKLADNVVMRFMDGLMAFPSFLLAIALVALLGASFQNVVLALSVVETPRVVRIVRGSVLSLRERQYVEGALAVGARPLRILATHIFPNLVAPLTVQATYVFALAILVEAGLSFLGAGVPPDVPSWGNMMGDANLLKQLAPWMIFFPGLFLSLTVLGGESAWRRVAGYAGPAAARDGIGRLQFTVFRSKNDGCRCESALFRILALSVFTRTCFGGITTGITLPYPCGSMTSRTWLAGMSWRVWVVPLGQRISMVSTVDARPSPNSRSRLSMER